MNLAARSSARRAFYCARVIYRKTNNRKRFLIVDAAMNDLLRPALYDAYHEIVPVQLSLSGESEITDVVGPICETGDFLARDRELPVMQEGDLVAILDAGAYGSTLSSNYNTRGRAAEVLVDGSVSRVIRKRESTAEQMRLEGALQCSKNCYGQTVATPSASVVCEVKSWPSQLSRRRYLVTIVTFRTPFPSGYDRSG